MVKCSIFLVKYLFVFFVLFSPLTSLFSLELQAQSFPSGIPFIKNYSKNDYHAATQNWAIGQDKRGVMYFGNNYGLLEFDGVTWQQFPLPNQTIVRSLAIDEQGRIYVGGQGEIGYFFPDERGSLQYHSLVDLVPKGDRDFADVWRIFVTQEGVFFATFTVIFQLQNGQITVIHPTQEKHHFDFAFYINDQLLVSELNVGLQVYEHGKWKIISDAPVFKELKIATLLANEKSSLLVTTYKEGIFSLQKDTLQQWQTAADNFLKTHQIYTAHKLSNGNYAIGMSNDGLIILAKNGQILQHFTEGKGIRNRTVLAIFQDQSGNLWLGLDNGIAYIELSSPLTFFNTQTGLPGTAYSSLVHDDKLYLATNNGVFYKPMDASATPLSNMPFKEIANTKGQAWSLQKVGDKLLLGHHEGAFEIVGEVAQKITDPYGSWLFTPLNQKDNYILEGTYTGLMLHELDENGRWLNHQNIANFEESARIIEQDDVGNIWIAHGYKGVYKLRLSDDLKQVEQMQFYNSKHGFPSDIFISLYKINGEIVFGTQQGVYRYNEQMDRFEKNDFLNELLGETKHIRRLEEDEQGNIWFSADKEVGILKKIPGKGYQVETTLFNRIKGELVDGFEHFNTEHTEHVIIGLQEGFAHFSPSVSKHYDTPFHTLIRQVRVTAPKDSLIFNGDYRDAHQTTLQQPLELIPRFSHRFNAFRFQYAAAFYEGGEHNQFRYFLEGFDDHWSEWTPQTAKEYTNLPFGYYTFKVKAKNVYDVEGEEAVYAFSIAPAWYETVWAKMVYVLLGLLALWALYGYILSRFKKEQQRMQAEKQAALEEKERQRRREAEKAEKAIIELKNKNLQAQIAHTNQELATSAMHLIQKNEALSQLKKQLQQLTLNSKEWTTQKTIKKLQKQIDENMELDEDWEQFAIHFDRVHENFLQRLRTNYPKLTAKDLRLCAYLRMNLSTKEIAPLLNISVRGVEVSRYRLRKKMALEKSDNLNEVMMGV